MEFDLFGLKRKPAATDLARNILANNKSTGDAVEVIFAIGGQKLSLLQQVEECIRDGDQVIIINGQPIDSAVALRNFTEAVGEADSALRLAHVIKPKKSPLFH